MFHTNRQTLPNVCLKQKEFSMKKLSKLSSFLLKVFAIAAVMAGGAMAFYEDFEGDTHSFTIVNGSQTNKWVVGTATADNSSKSAYISNDDGTTNAYTYTAASVVHMYRDVTFPTFSASAPCSLSFQWKGQGQTDKDYLAVYLVETWVTPTEGTAAGTSLGKCEGMFYTRWYSTAFNIPLSYSGTTKRLVFTWINDASSGANPPIAVDNIMLTGGYSVTQSGATFTVTNVGTIGNIQRAIDTIKTRARGQDCSIKFGDGTNFLNIGVHYINFNGGTSGTDWGNITLSGKVVSRYFGNPETGTINLINDVSVESAADVKAIRNSAYSDVSGIAIFNNSTKPLIISGGTVSSTAAGREYQYTGIAIRAVNAVSVIRITGGTVSVDSGTAILATGASSAITVSAGTVSATTGKAISTTGATSVVTVTGGTVSATGANATIDATGANAKITVTGGEVKAAGGKAISTAGAAVTISGGAVMATTGSAIYASNAGAIVAISGGSAISSGTTDVNPTIYMSHAIPTTTGPNVSVSGTGSVQNIAASNGYAIRTFGSVSVSGGAQVNANGYAISLESMGVPSTLTISGGTVSAAGGASSATIHAIGSRVTVLLNGGTVMNTGNGTAVNAGGPNGVVFVNGGEILADGTRIGTSGARVVAIERTGTATSYAEGSSTGLTVSPTGASATWAVNGGKSGVSYTRDANTGFFEVSGVTVSTPRNNVSASITFANGSAVYNGSERTHETATNGGFTAGTNPRWTYTYSAGSSPTGNESLSAAGKPVNAGNYSVKVTYDDSNNDGTKTVTFTITKANPTVIWPTGIRADAGQTLADVSLASYTNAGGTAGAFSWTTPATEVGASGSRSHSVTFTPTNANYNTLTQNVTVMVSGSTTAVLSPERAIPNGQPVEDAVVSAPSAALTAEFSAGPNPVGRLSGVVNFFRQGKRVESGSLAIYSASGNFVRKIDITDKSVTTGNNARRQVGSWDLRDSKGRQVPEGTYLARGKITVSGGKSERVSVAVGVR